MRKNTKCTLMNRILAAFLSFLLVTTVHAAKPLWTYSAPNPTSVTVSDGGTATVIYTVTNQSKRAKNLILQQTRGLSASPCHLAGKGSSCSLTLTINGSLIPKQGIHAGPVLCEQGNPNQCYRPSAANRLNITKGEAPPIPRAMISVSPATLNLTQGGPAQTVTLSNTSATAAENLLVTIPGTSAITVDAANTTCTSTLAANSSCQYSFLPGAQTETNTVITINGSNTTGPATVAADVSAVVITLSQTTLSFAVGGTSDPITVTNTSSDTAVTNLQIDIPAGSHLEVDASSTCTIGGNIPVSGSCIIVLTTDPNVSTETNTSITIHGDNTNAPTATVTTTSTTLSVNSPTAIQTLDADGTSTVSITVENTGSAEANDVQIQLPGSWNNVNISSDTCSSADIPPSGTCSFDIFTTTPNIAGQISIQGSNTNTTTTPFIAFRIGGGLVFSADGTTAKVVTETDIDTAIPWDPDPGCFPGGGGCTTIMGGTDKENGEQNTQNIVNSIGAGRYAAQVCNDYNGSTFTDWYLPAICEVGGTDSGPLGGCSIANIYDNLYVPGFPVFVNGTGGPATFYWSSTEDEFGPEFAWELFFPSGSSEGQLFIGPKEFGGNRVRCVRAFSAP